MSPILNGTRGAPITGHGRTLRHRRADRPRQPCRPRRDHRRWDIPRRRVPHLPFLIPGYQTAIAIVAVELLLLLAGLRHRFFSTSFLRSFVSVTVGGAIIASLSAALGVLAAG
jgi:hypothetical protein